MRRADLVALGGLALAALAGCSSADVSRNVYEGLRTREQLQPAPGADRREIPSYDEYQRSRSRRTTADD